MPEEISKAGGELKRDYYPQTFLFFFLFFIERKREEESEVDSALLARARRKHVHRPCFERNFTGYIR